LHSEHEISQLADDTSVILDGSEESLNETLLELEWFKKISGLKINFSKTQNKGTTDPLVYSLSLYEKTQINSLPD
jgi:hypothetical protein